MLKRKVASEIMLSLLIINIVTLTFKTASVKAEKTAKAEPEVQFIDFYNGTRLAIVDYGNGTKDYTSETFILKTGKLQLGNGTLNQSLSTNLPTSLEESTEFIDTTQTIVIEQEILLGFTYEIMKKRYEWSDGVWWLSTYATVGAELDIRFGLRLPVNVTLSYPEQMTLGNNYTFNATLMPIDKFDFNEYLFVFKANLWVEASVLGINIPRTVMFGPDVDKSISFRTPVGPREEQPLPSFIDIPIFEMIKIVRPDFKEIIDIISLFVKPHLKIGLIFGSEKITAEATATGDANVISDFDIIWSSPNQTRNFTVLAEEYDPTTNNATIQLSNFRYYFTRFKVYLNLLLDLNDMVHGWPLYWQDIELPIYTFDISWLVEGLYLSAYEGTIDSLRLNLYVKREIPPTPEKFVIDISIANVTPSVNEAYAGWIINTNVTVANQGYDRETFNVTAYYNSYVIGVLTVVDLNPSETVTLTFSLDTTTLTPCENYTIWAEVTPMLEENDTANNIRIGGVLKIRMSGDVRPDGEIDVRDIAIATKAFGSYPNHPRWNLYSDINQDGEIDVRDLALIAANFGKTCT